ncbi:InlB B-repeat-containing protein [Pseudoduganella aquatica]|uniref:InlB B-repeat-containing protein n=1 Tax=Pseudoduganella aquatica TaxID=2660641 RepID=UPI001E2933C6|nr:InlB B-repeat-containing protein [Pseudoduganella aquatica]
MYIATNYARANALAPLLMAVLLFALAACGGWASAAPPAVYTVSYHVEGAAASSVQLGDGALLKAPERPRKGSAYFAGWFVTGEGEGHMWDFAHQAVRSDVVLKAKFLDLSASNVVVDAYLDEARRTPFTFRTLQELQAANIPDGATVNFAPGVYWTDDYKDPAVANTPAHPGLIGISFPQSGLTFKGLTSNADDVRIAGNRGQTMGAEGNWNVIGIGTHFSAYNLTVANYATVDLVFPRDPSQNVARRTDARVQAQTITAAAGVPSLDRMYFENVRFISFLNLTAIGPRRAYFKNSHFQLTDDAIAGGGINVYDHCTFDFYGSHPSYGGSSVLAAFLHSTFNFHNDSPVFWWSKSGGGWVMIDNQFNGPKEEIRWENIQRPDVKHYVHNNRYADGTPVVFDPRFPDVAQTLTNESLKIFKIGEEYNVYNLLKGADGWNPSKQAARNDTAYKFTLAASTAANETVITPGFVPAAAYGDASVRYQYDASLFSPAASNNGKLHLNAKPNVSGKIIDSAVKASLPNGLVAQATLRIYPEAVAAPLVVGTPSIAIGNNTAALQIVYDHPEFADGSSVTWFRGRAPGDKAVQVAVSTLGKPYKHYQLSAGDIGHYLTAVIIPKYEFSPAAASPVQVASAAAVAAGDVAQPSVISTNFANISWTGHALNQPDAWYADAIKPSDIEQAWAPSGAAPWLYAVGDRDGAVGVAGLRTATQGARLLYQPQGAYADMTLTVDLTPEKAAGQGFGSATGQYFEVYIKWDPATQTGYALRFQRLSADPLNGGKPIPSSGNSVRVSMMEYVNGARRIFPGAYVESSVFMPGARAVFKLAGDALSADVLTASPQTSAQAGFSLPKEIHFQAHVASAASTLGGFGFQFTGTPSAGNRIQLEKLEVVLKPRQAARP